MAPKSAILRHAASFSHQRGVRLIWPAYVTNRSPPGNTVFGEIYGLRYNTRAFFLQMSLFSNPGVTGMEINPLLNKLSDLQVRTDVLRGYL